MGVVAPGEKKSEVGGNSEKGGKYKLFENFHNLRNGFSSQS